VIWILKVLVVHTLSSAAQAVGVARSTIYRAIKAGRLSAHKLINGAYVIYPGELFRVFPVEASSSRTLTRAKLQGFSFPAWDVS
jgi:excisionase family DNA binding protein